MQTSVSHVVTSPDAGATAAADTGDCPACGRTTDHRSRFRVNGCDILQCKHCGLGRTETIEFNPAVNLFQKLIARRWEEHLNSQTAQRHTADEAQGAA